MIDAAGSQAAVDQAFGAVRSGGTVVAMATYWSPVQVGLSMSTKEARFVPSTMYGHHHGTREFVTGAEVLAVTPELPDTLITHRFDLDDAAQRAGWPATAPPGPSRCSSRPDPGRRQVPVAGSRSS